VQPLDNVVGERTTGLSTLRDELGGCGAVEALEVMTGQVGVVEQRRFTLTHAEQHRDRIRDEPSEREQQGGRARTVEPLRVVDEDEQRCLIGARREKAERRGADGEAVLGGSGSQRERPFERLPLWRRETVEVVESRAQQLEQPGERDAGFRLHTARPQDVHPDGATVGLGEQRRLADPDLPDDGKDAAPARTRVVEQAVEEAFLPLASDQHGLECTGGPGTNPWAARFRRPRLGGVPGSDSPRVLRTVGTPANPRRRTS
jgi:hypothetical protein